MNSIEVISPEDFRSDVFKVVNDKIELALDPVSSNLFKQSDKGLFVKKDGELHYREEFVVDLRNYSNDLLEFKLEDVDFVLHYEDYNLRNHLMLNSSWYRNKWFKKSITLDVGDATDSVTRQMPYTTSDTDHLTPYCAFVSHDLTTQNRLRIFASDEVDITIFDITLHRLEGDSSLLVVEVTKTVSSKEGEESLPNPGELGDKVLVVTKVSNAAVGTDPFFLVTPDPDLLNCTLHAVGATTEGNPDFSNTLFTMPSYCPLSDVTPFFVDDNYGAIVTRDEIGRVYVRTAMVPDVIIDVMSDYRPTPGEELKAGFSISADYVVVGFENAERELNYCVVNSGQSGSVETFKAPLADGEVFVSSAIDGGTYVVIIKKADGSYKCARYALVSGADDSVVELGNFDQEAEKVYIYSFGFGIIALQAKFPDYTSKWTVAGMNPMTGSAIPLTWTDTGYLADLNAVSVNKFSIDINTFKISGVFVDYSNESLALLTFNIADNNLSSETVALPMEYLQLAMSGLVVPMFLANGQICFQEDASGTTLFVVEAGGDNTMYQTLAMFQGPYEYFVLATDISGELSVFPFIPDANKLVKMNILRDSAEHIMWNGADAQIAIHHETKSFVALDANLNVVLALPDFENGFYNFTVLGQTDPNRPPNRLVLNQSLTEEGRFVTAWFTDTREVTVYKVAPDLTVTTNVIGLEELPEEIELDEGYIRDYVNCCQVDKYLVYALPTKQGEEKANNELLIIDLVTGTKKVVFHSEAGYWMTLGLTAIGETLFTTDTLVAPFPEGVNDYYQRKLWKVENDLTIVEMDSINVPYYDNTPDAIGANRYLTAYGEVLHDIGPTTNPDYPVYIDVVTHIPSAKMGVIRIESTEEILEAAGMFVANGLPMMGYFRFDEMGQPIGLCVQGDFNLSTFAFHPFDTSNGDGGGEDNTPKEPRTLLGVYGDKGLMVNEANGDLYVAPFSSSQVVGSPVGASPSGNIPIIKKKLAIDSETGYYAYMKGWDVVFGSMGQDSVLATITVATTSREAEVAEITSIKSRDGTKVIFLIFIPAADSTGDAMHWRYEVDIMSGSVASKGLTRLNGRGGTISSAGIAITDKWIITHHPGEDGLIYLGPHDAGIVSKQYINMGNTSIDRLVTIGDNLFGVVYKDIPNSELPFLVYEVSDDGIVATKYYFTVDTDKVLIGGGLGPNSAFRKLGPGKYRAAVTLIGSGDYYNHVGFIDLNEGGRSTMGGDLVTLPEGVNLENLYTTIIGSSVDKIFYQAEPSKAEPGTTLSPYLG